MSVTDDRDLSKILREIDKRLYEMEQTVTSPSVMGSSGNGVFPGPITIGDGSGSPVVIDPGPPGVPTGLTVDVGAIYDNIYADLEWNAAATGPITQGYIIIWSLGYNGAQPIGNAVTGATNFRIDNLEPNTQYSVRVTPNSNIGVLGTATAWVNFTTGADTTVPPAPTGVVIARGATTVVVKFTPLTMIQAPDVANGAGIYEIEIDTTTNFNSGNLRTMRSGDQIVAFNDVLTEAAWYARVRAIDSSGNVSLWSATAGPSTAGGVIDSMIVAGLDAAKITFGTMSGSRITTNSLTADRIATGTMSAAAVTLTSNGYLWAGTGLGGSTPTGVIVSASGVVLYKAGAVSAWLNASNGNASFTGTISASTITGTSIAGTNITGGTIIGSIYKTDAGGPRMEIGSQGNANEWLAMYCAVSGEFPGSLYSSFDGVNHFTTRLSTPYVFAWSPTTQAEITMISRGNNPSWMHLKADTVIVNNGQSTGTFTVYGTKNFRVPHPLDPKNRDLVHSTLEGPENGVFYRGKGKTKKGKAILDLPNYFSALTEGFETDVFVTPTDKLCLVRGYEKGGKVVVEASEDCEFSWVAFSARGPAVEVEVPKDPRLEVESVA